MYQRIPLLLDLSRKKFVLSMIIRIFAAREPAKPLNDAQMRGVFLYIYVHSQNTPMERLPHFTKK